MDKGDYAKAKEFFEKAYEISKKSGAKYSQSYYAEHVAWSNIELGEIEKANELLNTISMFTHETKDKVLIAIAEALRGSMLRCQKKWEESIEHFERSLQEFESVRARQRLVYDFAKWCLLEYSRVYLERNQEGDKEKAHNLLNQALEIFEKLGARKDIEKILAKKKLLTA